MHRGTKDIRSKTNVDIEHDSDFESMVSPDDDSFDGDDAVNESDLQDPKAVANADGDMIKDETIGEDSEDEYTDTKQLSRVDVADPSMHRVFDKTEEALLIRVMIQTGCRLAYPEFKHAIASVLRDKGWKTAERLNSEQLENKILNKLKVLNKRVKRQELDEFHYLRDEEWFKEVERAIMQKVDEHASVPSQTRQYSSKSTNLRRSSQRLRYAPAEERMLRHWMVTLDRHAVKQVTRFYEGTRNNDMIKHKLRETRKYYSDKPEEGGNAWKRRFKIHPAGHFDSSSEDCWAPGPIPKEDIDAFNVRLHQLKQELGRTDAPLPSNRQSANIDTFDEAFVLDAFSMEPHGQSNNVDPLVNLDSDAATQAGHLTNASAAAQYGPLSLPRRVTNLIEVLRETVEAVKEAGKDDPSSSLPAYAKLLEQAQLGSVLFDAANKSGNLDDDHLAHELANLSNVGGIKDEQLLGDELIVEPIPDERPEPVSKRARRI